MAGQQSMLRFLHWRVEWCPEQAKRVEGQLGLIQNTQTERGCSSHVLRLYSSLF